MPVWAQTLTVRLIHAKNGHPMKDENVTLLWDGSFTSTVVRMNDHGEGILAIPPGAKSVSMMEGPRRGKEPGRVAYFDCNKGSGVVLLTTALAAGYVAENDCSKKIRPKPMPGQLIFLGLPRPWWLPDMQ
jgi:hypothetical protein